MSRNKLNKNTKPIENHKTAPWANIEDLKSQSRVPIPNELEVENAKEWVDDNEK
ncbi:CDIF630_02480 family spore surface protein [Crassaminicella profunda]|uniref:CDIF630_02480 family spore surface protein n=1 Tax=Crassaminicella profunda TaxID=1286698 RepID=UPI001CA6DD61|nr:DUF3787 domain-containing protein [Crassaminicella profunda]QZY55028.1 DUF3787 domain-containing protein [Crassaminicella profunda]